MRGMSRLNRAVLSFGLILAMAGSVWAVDYYVHGNFPSPSSPATSASMRAEFDLISSGFARLPALTGNANKIVIVNGGATGLTTTTGQLALGGNLTITGAFNTTLVQSASATFNLPGVSGTFATLDGSETLTTKTINLTSNTLTGTTAQFNTALSDNDFATLAGSETLTTKTINLASNTLSGTTAQFNTALSDNDFATLAGSETLTNKTLTSPTLAGTPVFPDNVFTVVGSADATKKVAIEVDGLTTGTTRTVTIQDADQTLVGRATTDTLTNKTLGSPVLSGTVTGTYTLGGTPTIPGSLTAGTILTKNPIAFSGVSTQAHGLGGIPTLYAAYLECLTTEQGWAVGDRVSIASAGANGNAGVPNGITIGSDSTTVTLSITNNIMVNHKTTGAGGYITAANWKLIVTPYRIN
jgi:hypothetical protein